MRRRITLLISLSLAALIGVTGCEKKEKKDKEATAEKAQKAEEKKPKTEEPVEPDPSKPATVGIVTVETSKSVKEVVGEMTRRLEKARSVSVIAEVDHAKNAESADMQLPATSLLLFSNPGLETPLIADSLGAGLEFPQKVLVWKPSEGEKTKVAFNAPEYVAKRHGVEHLGLFMGRMADGLANVVENSAGVEVPDIPQREDIGIEKGQGVISRESQNGVSDTFDKLAKLVEENDKLKLIAKVDHTQNAKSVNKELRPAKTVIFGNPKMGTPLMKKSPRVALDLPQKMYIYENTYGDILLTFNSPKYLAERHGIDPEAEIIGKMDKALKKIAATATEEIE